MQKRNTENKIPAAIGMLTDLLSGEYLLYGKTMEANWNMYGSDFNGNCPFFEYQFSELAQIIDSVSDCIPDSARNAYAILGPSDVASSSNEYSYHKNNSSGYLLELLEIHQAIIEKLHKITLPLFIGRKEVRRDELLTALFDQHQKMADTLRFRLASHYKYSAKPIKVPGSNYCTSQVNNVYAYQALPS